MAAATRIATRHLGTPLPFPFWQSWRVHKSADLHTVAVPPSPPGDSSRQLGKETCSDGPLTGYKSVHANAQVQ